MTQRIDIRFYKICIGFSLNVCCFYFFTCFIFFLFIKVDINSKDTSFLNLYIESGLVEKLPLVLAKDENEDVQVYISPIFVSVIIFITLFL